MATKLLILLGPPGIEIAAIADALASRWHVPHVAATALAEAGECATEDLFKPVRQRLEQPDAMLDGWILTGFPQTLPQAEDLSAWLAAVGQPPAQVVYLKGMTGLLISRLSSGGHGSASAIRRTLEQHQDAVAPLLTYYQERSQLETLNGSLPVAEVTSAIVRLRQETSGVAALEDGAALEAKLAQEPHLVVNCTAAWCGSCRKVSPLIDRLAQAYSTPEAAKPLPVLKIDFDANRDITKRFSLKGIPAVMFFKGGELVEAVVGVKSYSEYSAAAERLLAETR